MDMIAMLAGLGQADTMTQEERAVRADQAAAVARVNAQAEADRMAMLKGIGFFTAGALVGWFFRGYADRA